MTPTETEALRRAAESRVAELLRIIGVMENRNLIPSVADCQAAAQQLRTFAEDLGVNPDSQEAGEGR